MRRRLTPRRVARAGANPSPRPARTIRPPKQRRSHETLSRVLDAAETLIGERGIEGMTVGDVAERAGTSVGNLYGRFGDKEALVHSVFERFYGRSLALADGVFDADRWRDVPIATALRTAIVVMLRMFGKHRRLIAGFTVRSATSPELAALGERLGLEVADRAYRWLAARQERVAHPDPQAAVRFAVMMILSALEARALYTSGTLELLTEDAVATELTRMVLAYLGIPFEATADPRSSEHDREGTPC